MGCSARLIPHPFCASYPGSSPAVQDRGSLLTVSLRGTTSERGMSALWPGERLPPTSLKTLLHLQLWPAPPLPTQRKRSSERSPLPLRKWLLAVYLVWKSPETTAAQLARMLRVTYATAWRMRGRIQSALSGLDRAAAFEVVLKDVIADERH